MNNDIIFSIGKTVCNNNGVGGASKNIGNISNSKKFDSMVINFKNLNFATNNHNYINILPNITLFNYRMYVSNFSDYITLPKTINNSNVSIDIRYKNNKIYLKIIIDDKIDYYTSTNTIFDYNFKDFTISITNYSYDSDVSFDNMDITIYRNFTIIYHNNNFYSTNLFNDNTNEFVSFSNIEDIPEDKYITDLNNIVSTKNIDNLYPMNIIIKK